MGGLVDLFGLNRELLRLVCNLMEVGPDQFPFTNWAVVVS